MSPRIWPRCWKRVPAPLMREIAREVARFIGTRGTACVVEGPAGMAGNELTQELIDLIAANPSDERSDRALVLSSALYSLAELGDYVGELCCRIPRCTRHVWPSFDGVCFKHGMEEQPKCGNE